MAASGEDCWATISDFAGFQKCMIGVFKGEIGETPWAEIEEETENAPGLLDKLIQVSSMGFVTNEGQPGTELEIEDYKTNEKLREIQRGYLNGFLKKGKYDLTKLADELNKEGVYVIITKFKYNTETQTLTYDIVKNACPDGEECVKADGSSLPLTWYVSIDNPDKPIEYYTNLNNQTVKSINALVDDDIAIAMEGGYTSLVSTLVNDSVHMIVVNMTPGETNLEDKLLRAFSASMLPKKGGRRRKSKRKQRKTARRKRKNKRKKQTRKRKV